MKNKRRKALVVGAVVGGAVLLGGVAYAALGGTVFGSSVVVGAASGQGSCQSTAIDFTLATPAYNSSNNTFEIASVDYSGFASQCVTNSATLAVVVRNGSGTVYDQQTVTPSAGTGTITFASPVTADVAPSVVVDYLVTG